MSSYRSGNENQNYTGIPVEKNRLQDLNFSPSTLETVDYAMYDFINDKLSLRTTTNKGVQKVPVVWASAERSFQVKNNKEYRDDNNRENFCC